MSREVELGCESWTSFASGCSSTAVQRTLSLWLCPAQQLKQQWRSALVAVQWQGDTSLTLPLFWWRSTVSPISPPLPPLPPPPSLISNLASVDIKQHGPVAGSIPKLGRVRDRFSLSKMTPVHIHRCCLPSACTTHTKTVAGIKDPIPNFWYNLKQDEAQSACAESMHNGGN